MTTTLTRTRVQSPAGTRSRFDALPVWAVCVGAGVVGAAVLYGYGAVADALSVPMHAGGIGASHAQAITPASFSIGVAFSMVLGTLLAVGIGRWSGRPARVFLRAAVALTVVSLAFPLTASYTEESTRFALALGHLVAAAVIVPIVTRRLAAVPAGRSR